MFHKSGSNGMLKYSAQMKRISSSKSSENVLNSTTTSVRWDEDTELLFSDNAITEDFSARADNPVAIEFRHFNDKVYFS